MPRKRLRTPLLRAALLEQAIAALEKEGPLAIQARRVATAAGTSTAALYELFGDKTGLVREIFYEGFRMLAERLEQPVVSDDARVDLIELLRVSRSFAIEHPMMFELMYARPFAEFQPDREDLRVADRIYDLVVHRVQRWLTDAGSATDAVDAAHTLVALNRGLIETELTGLLGRTRASRDRRWSLGVQAHLAGLSTPHRADRSGSQL